MATKDKNEAPKEAKPVTRFPYEVLHAKNFGKGIIQPGKTIELSKEAGEHYKDLGFVKPLKKK